MGALARATKSEIEELVAGDPQWWIEFCGAVAEGGQAAIKAERELRGWSWGALWGWIVGDVERYRDYTRSLEAYVQERALETIGIADKTEDHKLRVDTRFRLAGKVDRVRWGDQVQHTVVVDSFGEMLKRVSERKLAALRQGQEPRVIEHMAAEPADSEDEI